MSGRVEQKRMKPYGRWQYVANDGYPLGDCAVLAEHLPNWCHISVAAGRGRIARVRVVEVPEPKAKKARSKR